LEKSISGNKLQKRKHLIGIQRLVMVRPLIMWIVLFTVLTACTSDQHESNWLGEEALTIGQYLETNQKEYSKFYTLLVKGKMLSPLYAYNPHGEGYTLFLPTDEAVDHFIRQSQKYGNFDDMLKDTGFIYTLMRYHTINRKIRTDEFPDGALSDMTLSGDRLSVGFYTDGHNQIIKVNNIAPIVKSNLEMTNGYVHVVSEVLQQVEISGYDWLQQQGDYSILAQAMELSGIRGKIKWNKYTILGERDTIYHRKGIKNIEDLIKRVATPGVPFTSNYNAFYLFTAFHILSGEFYLNDFTWGESKYPTLANRPITISAGQEIMFNPGVEPYGITISESGDTTVIDYISPVWEVSNIMTHTGPVHSISEVLFYEPFPK
jgi:uncharacterized surface protein with fasciclin (FAS1) repeats